MNDAVRHARPLRRGLYLITPDEADDDRLAARLAPLLRHAACVQYRNKAAPAGVRARQAARLQALCAASSVPLVVNDDVAAAVSSGAAGVHLGRDDGDVATARARLGAGAIVGVSCYDDPARARAAAADGADYVAFGAFFPSPSKPGAPRAGLRLLREAIAPGIARVAIGGITPENAATLVAAGADLVAVISGVFDAPDPAAAARDIAALFYTGHDHGGRDRGAHDRGPVRPPAA